MDGLSWSLRVGYESRRSTGKDLKGASNAQAVRSQPSQADLSTCTIVNEKGTLFRNRLAVEGVIWVLVGKVVLVMLKWIVEEEGVKIQVLRERRLEAAGDGRHDGGRRRLCFIGKDERREDADDNAQRREDDRCELISKSEDRKG